MNLNERNLSGTVVSQVARISDSTLRQWRRRGFLPAVTNGPNAWPTYSLLDALKVAVLAELGRYGVDLTFGARMIGQLDFVDDIKDLRKSKYLRAGQGGWVTDEDGKRHANPVDSPSLGIGRLTTSNTFALEKDDEDDTVVIAVDVAKVFRRIEAELKQKGAT